jgi:hypothetical protein
VRLDMGTSEPEQNLDLGSACGRHCQENDRRQCPEIDQNGSMRGPFVHGHSAVPERCSGCPPMA